MCDGFKKVQILQTRIILGVPLFQETSMFSFVIRSDFHFEGHPQVISMPAGVCVCVSRLAGHPHKGFQDSNTTCGKPSEKDSWQLQ